MKAGKEFPEEGELVVATVTNVRDYGAFVKLEEYPGKEGFVHVSEVTTGWVKYIRDHIREGQKIVGKVMRVNRDRNQVDISIKRVTDNQRRKKMQEWKNEMKARMLMEMLAKRLGKSTEECYREFGYRLMDIFGGIYPAFEAAVLEEDALEEEGFEGSWVKEFKKIAEENITPPFVTISGTLEIRSEAPDGVEIVKKALKKAKESGDNIDVYYVGSPKYRIRVISEDYRTAEKMMKKAADAAIEYVTEAGGTGEFHRKEA